VPHFRQDYLNISLQYAPETDAHKTLFKNKKVEYDSNGKILVAPILDMIKREGFAVKNHAVMYYSHVEKTHVSLGRYPVP
jgi:hypothetical protein